MSERHMSGQCFWDGREVPEREYLRLKFCWCGARNSPDRLMCARCIKAVRSRAAAIAKAQGSKS